MRCLVPLLLLLPAAALADPFDDFRIPEHRVFSWNGSLSASGGHLERGSPYLEMQDGGGQGSLGTTASWLYDSDPRLTVFSLDAKVGGNRYGADLTDQDYTQTRRSRALSEQWTLSLRDRHYPWSAPLGLEFAIVTNGTYGQAWNKDQWSRPLGPGMSEDRRESDHTEQYDYRVIGGATLGAGRVRDATAVYDVSVLEDRLRHRGVLRGPLAVETRQRLAALIYHSSSYDLVLDRPGRWFWEDFIDILKRDDSYAETWDPAAALRVLEPYFGPNGLPASSFFPQSPVARQRGWFVGVASQAAYYATVHHDASSFFLQQTVNDTLQPPITYESATSGSSDGTLILVGPQLEWHRPLGLHWQADAFTSQMFPTRGKGGMSSRSSAWLYWLVTDRWLASLNGTHELTLARAESGTFANAAWAVRFGGSLSWFLENHLLLTVLAGTTQQDDLGGFGRDYSASLSLGYRFAGRLENPGLTGPIRVP